MSADDFGVVFEETPPLAAEPPSPATIAAVSPYSPVAEELRVLTAKLRVISEKRPLRVVGVVSAAGGEGKTLTSLGLATALARQADRRVLLVEVDLRKPSIDRALGLQKMRGVAEWLESLQPGVAVRRITPQNFFLLSAGRTPSPRPDLLGSPRMAQLIAAARESFDYVVLDCPPLVPIADSVLLQDLVDGFIMVVRARHSPIEVIQRALSNLKPGRVVGVVLNDHREMLRSYYSYGSGYYGERR